MTRCSEGHFSMDQLHRRLSILGGRACLSPGLGARGAVITQPQFVFQHWDLNWEASVDLPHEICSKPAPKMPRLWSQGCLVFPPCLSTLQQGQGMPSGTVISAQCKCHVGLSASAPALYVTQI